MKQFEWFWDGFILFFARSAQILPDFGCRQRHLIWTQSILTWKLTCNSFCAVTRVFETERVAFAIARKDPLATDSRIMRWHMRIEQDAMMAFGWSTQVTKLSTFLYVW